MATPSIGRNGLIAVFGATGRQGGEVARRLLAEGWRVRAITRRPQGKAAQALAAAGAELAEGNLDRGETLDRAMAGVDGVFGVTDFWEHDYDGELRQGTTLIESAKRLAVPHVVFSSVGATDRTAGLGIRHFDAKAEIEKRLTASGLRFTILRPVTFLENFLVPRYRKAICEQGLVRFGFNETHRFQLVAMHDLAVFAAKAFAGDPRLVGRATEIASDAVTMSEFVRILSKATNRTVRYSQLSQPLMRLIGAFIVITGRQGLYRAGPSLINQFRWNNESPIGGWNADIGALRRIHPDLMSVERWARTVDWQRD